MLPKLYPTQEGNGSRLVREKDQDCVRCDNSTLPLWRKRGSSYLVPARPGSNSGEDMGHRLGKIDVARGWAAASAYMKKKSRWSLVKGPMTAKYGPCTTSASSQPLHGNGTLAVSSMRCNKDSPTRFGNRLHCIITVSVR